MTTIALIGRESGGVSKMISLILYNEFELHHKGIGPVL